MHYIVLMKQKTADLNKTHFSDLVILALQKGNH